MPKGLLVVLKISLFFGLEGLNTDRRAQMFSSIISLFHYILMAFVDFVSCRPSLTITETCLIPSLLILFNLDNSVESTKYNASHILRLCW